MITSWSMHGTVRTTKALKFIFFIWIAGHRNQLKWNTRAIMISQVYKGLVVVCQELIVQGIWMNFLVGVFPYLKRAETSFTVHVCSQDNLEDESTSVWTELFGRARVLCLASGQRYHRQQAAQFDFFIHRTHQGARHKQNPSRLHNQCTCEDYSC